MNKTLDMECIYREERKRWLREEAPRQSFQDIVADSVRYWIVTMALVLFGLSAPHTAEIFNMLRFNLILPLVLVHCSPSVRLSD